MVVKNLIITTRNDNPPNLKTKGDRKGLVRFLLCLVGGRGVCHLWVGTEGIHVFTRKESYERDHKKKGSLKTNKNVGRVANGKCTFLITHTRHENKWGVGPEPGLKPSYVHV